MSFLLHVSSYSALYPSLIAIFDMQKKRIASFRFAIDNTLVSGSKEVNFLVIQLSGRGVVGLVFDTTAVLASGRIADLVVSLSA